MINPLDKSNIFGSIVDLPKQVQHAWEESQKVIVPEEYKKINKIVMCGMGGSLLGAKIIQAVFGNNLAYPLVLINDYDLPGWVDDQTLVLCSSYSGSTEETLSNFQQALEKKAKLIVITAGGKLLESALANNLPVYKINPVYNPSKQPRMAIGYSVIGQLVLCQKAGLLNLDQAVITELIEAMKQIQPEPAQALAKQLETKQVIFVAAEHLAGAVHTVKNQMNENAKHLSHRHDLPELNHHLMEGLRFPVSNPATTMFWFINSLLYSERLQQRLKLTQEVVEKNNLTSIIWQATAKSKLAQTFELIQFGAYVNFYLSQLHGLDPAAIPWVDYFKKQLEQPTGSLLVG